MGVGVGAHLEGRGKEPPVAWAVEGLASFAHSPELPLLSPQPQEQCNSPHVKSKHLAASAMLKINQERIGGIRNHNTSWIGKEGVVHYVKAKAGYLRRLNSFVS